MKDLKSASNANYTQDETFAREGETPVEPVFPRVLRLDRSLALPIVASVCLQIRMSRGEHTMRMHTLGLVLTATLVAVFASSLAFGADISPYSVRHFGAKGDGTTKDTASVQKAIDKAAENGGGTVLFPPGVYFCGGIHLRSNITLSLDAGAIIKGSRDKEDFDPYEKLDFKNDADIETTFFHYALIWGEGVEHVSIIGQGTIDSNFEHRHGPKTIALKRCRFVEIRGVHLLNAPNYNISMLGTDFVTIDGVTILNGYADGIDPDACRNVRISNCHIEAVDDAIVPKASFSLGERRGCENITVTNCYLATDCNAFKLGTESGGDFKRIAVSNCVMSGLKGHRPASGGVCLESVDGSNIDGVVASNLTMVNVRAPIFIRLGNRGRDMPTPVPGSLKNVSISDIVATDASNTCSISGIPGHNVEGVAISNVRITWKGGCPYRPDTDAIPESINEYPDPDIFDALSAYGFYCRHVDGLSLSNIHLQFNEGYWRLVQDENGKTKTKWATDDGVPQPSKPGHPGHAIVCDDVAGLDIDGLRAQPDPAGDSLLRFINVRDATIRGCTAAKGTKVFLEAVGSESRAMTLTGNVLKEVDKVFVSGEGLPQDAVAVEALH